VLFSQFCSFTVKTNRAKIGHLRPLTPLVDTSGVLLSDVTASSIFGWKRRILLRNLSPNPGVTFFPSSLVVALPPTWSFAPVTLIGLQPGEGPPDSGLAMARPLRSNFVSFRSRSAFAVLVTLVPNTRAASVAFPGRLYPRYFEKFHPKHHPRRLAHLNARSSGSHPPLPLQSTLDLPLGNRPNRPM